MQRIAPLILVVEHDAALRMLFEELLTSAGYLAVGCETALEAHQLISAERPDLLIVDVHVERREAGLDVLQLLRLVPATMVLPILVCSADATFLRSHDQEFQVRHCVVVAKPFEVATLLAAIEAAIGAGRIRDRAVGA